MPLKTGRDLGRCALVRFLKVKTAPGRFMQPGAKNYQFSYRS